jgi:hypothetical protein
LAISSQRSRLSRPPFRGSDRDRYRYVMSCAAIYEFGATRRRNPAFGGAFDLVDSEYPGPRYRKLSTSNGRLRCKAEAHCPRRAKRKRLLVLIPIHRSAVGDDIPPRLMLQKLADLGAKDGMLFDGGGSSSMAWQRRQRRFGGYCLLLLAACGNALRSQGSAP